MASKGSISGKTIEHLAKQVEKKEIRLIKSLKYREAIAEGIIKKPDEATRKRRKELKEFIPLDFEPMDLKKLSLVLTMVNNHGKDIFEYKVQIYHFYDTNAPGKRLTGKVLRRAALSIATANAGISYTIRATSNYIVIRSLQPQTIMECGQFHSVMLNPFYTENEKTVPVCIATNKVAEPNE